MENIVKREEAQQLAIAALGFVAADNALLYRFLTLTGIEASRIRQAVLEEGFLAGVLNFLSAHEPDLLDFCATTATAPEKITSALACLPGGADQQSKETA